MPRPSRKRRATQHVNATTPKKRIWNCAVYARLSVEDSGRKGTNTIEAQIELVTSYIINTPYLTLNKVYIDNGVSGKNFDRPAWKRLLNDINICNIDCICVKDLSRFSRNYIETFEYIEIKFPHMGVRFISVNDTFDSNISDSKNETLAIALKSLVHSQYLKDLSRKKISSNEIRRNRGEFIGAFAPFGYKISRMTKGKLEPDDKTSLIVQKIFILRAHGYSYRKICKELEAQKIPGCRSHKWNMQTICNIVSNPVYLGHLTYGKTHQFLAENKKMTNMPASSWAIIENTHEPIIDKNLWEMVNSAHNSIIP